MKTLKNNILIASHRGVSGGNVIENTRKAFDMAILSGADIIELDVVKSTDGVYYVFHDQEEQRMLQIQENIHTLSSHEIEALYYYNRYGALTSQKVESLKTVLLHLKNRSLINVDRIGRRGYEFLKGVLDLVCELAMFDQVIFKIGYNESLLRDLSSYPYKFMFMPIVTHQKQVSLFEQYGLNIVGLELVFKTIDDPMISDENIRIYQSKGYALWVNTICFDEKVILSGPFEDASILLKRDNDGLKLLLDKGFTIIQTDFPGLIKQQLGSLTR